MKSPREDLKAVKTFPELTEYLRRELNWPIESTDFEELVFDYEPHELGIDAESAVKIQQIKQLRPLSPNQPWGIFFIKFEPKRLPVVVLRRILGQLVIKKRASARKSEQASWQLHDLLFISNYGEGDHRQITFAHFTQDENTGDLPTLRVLGWDDADTVLHLDHTHEILKSKLSWPAKPADLKSWREQWASAFILRHREVITTSQDLARRLADLARSIRLRASQVLSVETKDGALRKLYEAFQEALIHDLSEDDFADMYAQTIAYGLLAARVSRPMGIVADNVADMVPVTNPFLKEMLSTFLTAGGRKGRIDFDELGVQEVVDLLNSTDTHMDAVLRDFGNRTRQEDPVIHFYELFLAEYDKKKKVQRGVFYTPLPVVSYIVRSVHELLQTEFGLEDGLADTATWRVMAKRNPDIKLPDGVKADDPFVHILDPATGTATFLVEVIDIIHKTMAAKWLKQGHMALQITDLWNDYVPKHLLPRLYGFEILMAPYSIAHMKLGLKLYETGYKFQSGERLNVYLTNSLEPASDAGPSRMFAELAPALATEAQAVNGIKGNIRFTVVIGNPPYANFGRQNRNPFILSLLDDYKLGLNERKINLDDDYIKFIRFAQHLVAQTSVGIWSFISNNSFYDGITHRRMRESLIATFPQIKILDLHGNLLAQEKMPNGSPDENVFDIQQGVGITIGIRHDANVGLTSRINYNSLLDTRERKYRFLIDCSVDGNNSGLNADAKSPYFFFVPQKSGGNSEYATFVPISEVFHVLAYGIQTKQDGLFVDFDKSTLSKRLHSVLLDVNSLGVDLASQKHGLGSSSGWSANRLLGLKYDETKIRQIYYRPFDWRWIYYDRQALGRARYDTMRHVLSTNLSIIAMRQVFQDIDEYSHFGVTHTLIDERTFYSNRGGTYLFPFFISDEDSLSPVQGGPHTPNFTTEFIDCLQRILGINLSSTNEKLLIQKMVRRIASYMYSIFHSPKFRQRYASELRIDFPRLPITSNQEMFARLASLGEELLSLHLMESDKLNQPITRWTGRTPSIVIGKALYSDSTVWIDSAKTMGFCGVPDNVWRFCIGGYQVCDKWLKDRKGRSLSAEDIIHYQKIIVALSETIRIMAEIDRVIDAHGGWPGAFAGQS